MLRELTGEQQAHGGLHLLRSERLLFIVLDEAARLLRNLLKDIVDEAAHDVHGLLGDRGVGVVLL